MKTCDREGGALGTEVPGAPAWGRGAAATGAASSSEAPALVLLGVNYRNATLAVREGLRLDDEAQAAWIRAVLQRGGLEAFVVSTCNRTELLVVGAPGHADLAVEAALGTLADVRPASAPLCREALRWRLDGLVGVQHLLRLASGLESAILGDGQVLGQIRAAARLAAEQGGIGVALSQVLASASRCGRRVRRETGIGAGGAGVASAIVSMIGPALAGAATGVSGEGGMGCALAGSLPRIVVVGAGVIARDVVRGLVKIGLRDLVVVNRTPERARDLAAETGTAAAPWADLPEVCRRAAVVVAATGAPGVILGPAELEACRGEDAPPLLVIDAGVPRNVAQAGRVRVMDIDRIRERQAGALAQREAAVPAAGAIVVEEMERLRRWWCRRPLEAELRQLFSGLESLEEQLGGVGLGRADLRALRRRIDRQARVARGLPPRLRVRQSAIASA